MSKSKGNGVAPSIFADKYGSDSLRATIMFGGPPEHDLNFESSQVSNMAAFLQKVQRLADKF